MLCRTNARFSVNFPLFLMEEKMDCHRDQTHMFLSRRQEKEVLGEFLRTKEISLYECPKCGVMVEVIVPCLYRMRSIK